MRLSHLYYFGYLCKLNALMRISIIITKNVYLLQVLDNLFEFSL